MLREGEKVSPRVRTINNNAFRLGLLDCADIKHYYMPASGDEKENDRREWHSTITKHFGK
jgi:hypothetical protein